MKFLIWFLLSFQCFFAFTQHAEIGLIGGSSYYIGEINPSKHLINEFNPALGVFYRKNLNKRYALRGGVNVAKLSASDDITASDLSEFRQLSFSGTLLEGYGILEFNFLPYQINNYKSYPYTPYVFIGAAIFRVSSTIENDGMFFIEEPNSAVISYSMPFGLGFKFDLSSNLGMGIEWGIRKTWTDQIDGLAESYSWGYQLSNNQNKDWYAIVGITLNYKILTERDRCPGVIN